MKQFFTLALMCLTVSIGFSQDKNTAIFEDHFQVKHIPIKYVAYDDKDQKLCSGEVLSGQKIGEWKFYDTEGKVYLKRKYWSNNSYEQTFIRKDKTIDGATKSVSITRGSNQCYPFHFVKEADISYSASHNQLVWFSKQTEIVAPETIAKAIKLVYNNPEQKKYTTLDLKDLDTTFQLQDGTEIIGFITKTEAFFDNKRILEDKRIIAIQAIAQLKDGSRIVLPCLYYPQIREQLAQQPIETFNLVENLDDLFYFNLFMGPILWDATLKERWNTPANQQIGNITGFNYASSIKLQDALLDQLSSFYGAY